MNSPIRLRFIVLVTLIGMLLFVALVQALATNPQTLFTQNIAALGPSLNVTEMEQQLLDRINSATNSIDLAIYDFNRVSIRDALIAAHGRGVAVRVVTDDDAYQNAAYTPHFAALESAGITVKNDARSSIMHNKFFVIDGEIVWSGSTNITDNGFTYNHENSLVFTSTLLADIYTLEFEEMFVSGLYGTHKTDNVTHTIDYDGIPVEIYFSPSDSAMDQVLAEVGAATSDIRFGIFFFTDDELGQLMVQKAQEGVDIAGVWDALGAGNQYSEDETLCNAGIPIKIEDFGGKLHNKFMVIDANGPSPRVITGSMNWSASGDEDNDENTLIIHDADVAQAYLDAFQELYDALGSGTLCVAEGQEFFVYMPIINKPLPTPTPTNTPTPTSTPTATKPPTAVPPTNTPTATATRPPGTTGNVDIIHIHYDGAGSQEPDEYVEIKNNDSIQIQLQGWTLRDNANHIFTFPSFVMNPGKTCRIYTNQYHPESCGFNYGSGSAIWNNSGDCAFLRNSAGVGIDTRCYP